MKLKVIKKNNNSAHCFVCGLSNPSSLRAHYYELEGDILVGICHGSDIHQSYPHRMHGGIIAALLDETIGRAINISEPLTFGVTVSLEIKYKKPVPLNEEIKIVGKIIKNTSRVFVASGFIENNEGHILATCTATYVKQNVKTIAGKEFTDEDWFLVPDNVEYIDVFNVDYFNDI